MSRNLVAMIFLVAGLLFGACLVTHDPGDPPGNLVWPPNATLKNVGGEAGAAFAHYTLRSLGYGALFAAATCLVLAWRLFQPQPLTVPTVRAVGWLMALVGLTTLTSLGGTWFPLASEFGPGGFLGASFRALLATHLTQPGAYLFATSLLAGGLLLCTDYAMVNLTLWLVGKPGQSMVHGAAKLATHGVNKWRDVRQASRRNGELVPASVPTQRRPEALLDSEEDPAEQRLPKIKGKVTAPVEADEEYEYEEEGDYEYEDAAEEGEEEETWEEANDESNEVDGQPTSLPATSKGQAAGAETRATPRTGLLSQAAAQVTAAARRVVGAATSAAGTARTGATSASGPASNGEPQKRRDAAALAGDPGASKPEAGPRGVRIKGPPVPAGSTKASQLPEPVTPQVPDPDEGYRLPPLNVLLRGEQRVSTEHEQQVRHIARLLEKTFQNFGFRVRVVEIETGPVISQYEVELEAGLRLSKITSLSDDLAIALRVPSVRIVAPIPGKNTVGIEVPNKERQLVRIREVIEQSPPKVSQMRLPLFLGKDVSGNPLIVDLTSLPHLLIAGRTGTGKSVCLNSLIVSMLMTRGPEDVRMLMIDPKMVELSPYKTLPHLMHPVVTDMKKAEAILGWAVDKMEERYALLARAGVRHMSVYNQLGEEELYDRLKPETEEEWDSIPKHLPYIVIIADEMADLMMTAPKEVETHIIRLAQKSRAVGIHLVLATQKPTVDVITGLIKSNLPARIAFQVASRVDSRVVLDEMGADKLLGNGDMLFLYPGTSTMLRGQGTYVSDEEITKLIEYVGTDRPQFVEELVALKVESAEGDSSGGLPNRDDLYAAAVDVVVREGRGSVSLLQRSLGIGYGRAARLIDYMAEDGIVGAYNGSQAREVTLTPEQWAAMQRGESPGGKPSAEPPEKGGRSGSNKARKESRADPIPMTLHAETAQVHSPTRVHPREPVAVATGPHIDRGGRGPQLQLTSGAMSALSAASVVAGSLTQDGAALASALDHGLRGSKKSNLAQEPRPTLVNPAALTTPNQTSAGNAQEATDWEKETYVDDHDYEEEETSEDDSYDNADDQTSESGEVTASLEAEEAEEDWEEEYEEDAEEYDEEEYEEDEWEEETAEENDEEE